MLPRLDAPRILDVGCGSGGPTLELARLSAGYVVGMDVDEPALDALARRIRDEGGSHGVSAVRGSMRAMCYGDQSFDLLWSEASIYAVGFDRGLREWRRLLVPGGFLAAHEMVWLRPDPPREIRDYWQQQYPGIRSVARNLEAIPDCGYRLVGHYALPEDTWWAEYYGPLESRIRELREKCPDDPDALDTLDQKQRETDLFRKYRGWYGSAYFVMQKPGGEA